MHLLQRTLASLRASMLLFETMKQSVKLVFVS